MPMDRPHENEYFARIEQKRKEKLRARAEESEAERLRELHWHRCGKCGHAMETRTHQGVEIEVCPLCGAVLLDPGEFEQLIGEATGDEGSGPLQGLLSLFR